LLAFLKQELSKDYSEAECKNEAIGSTGFTSTGTGSLFGKKSGTGFGTSSSLFGQEPTTGFGATGVERFIA